MIQRQDRHVIGQYLLGGGIVGRRVGQGLGLGHQRIKGGAAEFAVVRLIPGGHDVQECRRLIIVAAPGIAGEVKLLLRPRLQIGFPLVILQRDVHPQLLPGHLRHHGGQRLVRVGRVIDQRQIQRVVGAKTCGNHQFQRLGVAFRLGPAGISDGRRLEPGGKAVGQAIGRILAALQHGIHDHIAVDHIGQRLAHPHILQRRVAGFAKVDGVEIGTEIGHRCRFIRVRGLEVGILADRNVGLVHFTGQIAGQGQVFIIDDQRGDGFNDGIGIVPIGRVARHDDAFVGHVFGQHIGPVRHHVARLGPVLAKFLNRRAVGGEQGGKGRHRGKERRGFRQLHLQRMVINRFDTQLIRRHFPGDNRRGIHDGRQFQIPGIFRCRRGVCRPLPGINEITRHQGIAVRPSGILAQIEGIGLVVRADRVAFGDTGHQIALFILIFQPFEQVAGDIMAGIVLDQLRVQRRHIVEIAVGIGLIVRQRLSRHLMNCLGMGQTGA